MKGLSSGAGGLTLASAAAPAGLTPGVLAPGVLAAGVLAPGASLAAEGLSGEAGVEGSAGRVSQTDRSRQSWARRLAMTSQ